jgi:hypothetical protein
VAAVGPSATTAWHRLRLRTERPVAPLLDEDLQTV